MTPIMDAYTTIPKLHEHAIHTLLQAWAAICTIIDQYYQPYRYHTRLEIGLIWHILLLIIKATYCASN